MQCTGAARAIPEDARDDRRAPLELRRECDARRDSQVATDNGVCTEVSGRRLGDVATPASAPAGTGNFTQQLGHDRIRVEAAR